MNYTETLKTVAGYGFRIISRIALITLSGAFLNMLFLIFSYSEMRTLLHTEAASSADGGGISGFFILIYTYLALNWKLLLFISMYFFFFPLAYFLTAKSVVISSTVKKIVAENKDFIIEYIVRKLFDRLDSVTGWKDRTDKSSTIKIINEYLPKFLKKLDGIPFIIKMIVRFFLERIPFHEVFTSIVSEEGKIELSPESVSAKLSEVLNDKLDETVFSSNYNPVFIVAGINLVIFIGLKIAI